MMQKYRQGFRYARLIAKMVGLVFSLVGILIFMIQNVSAYGGMIIGVVIFVIGALLWALDTLWNALDDWKNLSNQIKVHNQPNSN
jgi:uncharacterized membrane protein